MSTEQHIPTLTRKEMQVAARERLEEITKEFSAGFKFLEDHPTSVTFFGGSLIKENSPEYENARNLAKKIVLELGYSVLSGGGPGIMEAANRGAFEAGGKSLGLTIDLPHAQVTNGYINDRIDFYYFFIRKVCLSFSAEAFIFFPGAFGTLDEFFELVTLIQTKKIVGVPLICFGSAFWKPLENFMHEQMLARGTINEEDLSLYTITDDLDEIIDLIKKAPLHVGHLFEKTTNGN